MKFKLRRAIYTKDIIMYLYLYDGDSRRALSNSRRILFGNFNLLETLIKHYSDDYNT